VVFNLIWSKWKPTILWRVDEGDRLFADLRRSIRPISEWGDRIGARTPAAAQASDAHIVDQ
jgi:hypothetical protein